MPKPRVIDGSFWNDLDMAELTRDERLLVAGMITKCADDYGRMVAHPKHLRREVFGYDEDLSVGDVATMRDHIIERCRNVVLYADNGQEYIYFPNWQKWQKIRYKIDSKLPVPPEVVTESDAPLQEIPESSGKFPLGSVVLGRVEKGCSSVGLAEQTHDDDIDFEFRKLGSAWANARGGLVNPLDSEELHTLREEYTYQWVYDAIIEANSARSRGRHISMNFVKAILARWQQEGKDTAYDHVTKAADAVKAEAKERDRRQLAAWEAKNQ